ncbi:MAG: hypothetical protein JNK32_02995, partial [Anaerolineales bacterium]|nr:hypothetical protein [Anaerolineales bacterium]
MRKLPVGLVIIFFILSACGAPTPDSNVDLIVTQTLQALTAAAPTQAPSVLDGEAFTSGGVSFVVPTSMASSVSATTTVEVEFPYINPSAGEMPQHSRFNLVNYPAQGTIFEPHILVFKASEYAAYTDLTAQIVATLTSMNYADGQPI